MYRTLYDRILGGEVVYRYVDLSISELSSGVKVFCAESKTGTATAFIILNLSANNAHVTLKGKTLFEIFLNLQEQEALEVVDLSTISSQPTVTWTVVNFS